MVIITIFHNYNIHYKTKYMHFNYEGAIFTLNGGPMKLVDKFMYLGSSISSTESDVSKCLAKVLTAIEYGSLIYLTK